MQVEVVGGELNAIETEALVVGVLENSKGQPPWTVAADRALGGAIAARMRAGDMLGRPGELMVIPGGSDLAAKRVILVGLGKREEVDRERIRRAIGRAVRWLDEGRAREAVFALHHFTERQGSADATRSAAEALVLAAYRSPAFGERRAAPPQGGPSLERARLFEPGMRGAEKKRPKAGTKTAQKTVIPPKAALAAVHIGQVVAESANLARRLVELPANHLTPRLLAAEAVQAAKAVGLRITVHDESWMRERKMGSILGVAQGSAEPPRFIVIEHRPRRAARARVALVGKGVTFDSGGISLKPHENMDRMKYDMSGAAAVIGTLRAAAILDFPVAVTGIMPVVENLPSGTAVKPGDVLLSMAGKSIEVINTDAEGRLILADALAYARGINPDVIIDIATLTGACRIALGSAACGLTGNDPALIDELRAAGDVSGERAWPLPLYTDYSEELVTEVADLKNTGGRYGGALIAAAFLKAFAGDQPWAHLDIAGVAWLDKDRDYLKCGSAGFGVRLLTTYLERLASH